jgi:hypothetical protein
MEKAKASASPRKGCLPNPKAKLLDQVERSRCAAGEPGFAANRRC